MTHKKNGKGKHPIIHGDQLQLSKVKHVELAVAVEERFLQLCQLHLTATGTQLPIPRELNRDMLKWRRMRVRHKQGDFRHTEYEYRSVKTVAEWTLEVKFRLIGQEPPVIDWGD